MNRCYIMRITSVKKEGTPKQSKFYSLEYEPRPEKTCHRGFRPGLTQIGLYSHRRWLAVFEVKGLYYVAKTKMLTSSVPLLFFFFFQIGQQMVDAKDHHRYEFYI